MWEHARVVRDHLRGVTRDAFGRDRMMQLGVTHALQIIGEAARQVPTDVRQRYPTFPWAVIVGMRHRLVHEYHRLDLDRVWDTATRDMEPLIAALEALTPGPPDWASGTQENTPEAP
jgi:uncharacterized protein with HEPN domain